MNRKMNNNYFEVCIISVNYLAVAPIITITYKKELKGKREKKKLWKHTICKIFSSCLHLMETIPFGNIFRYSFSFNLGGVLNECQSAGGVL